MGVKEVRIVCPYDKCRQEVVLEPFEGANRFLIPLHNEECVVVGEMIELTKEIEQGETKCKKQITIISGYPRKKQRNVDVDVTIVYGS